MHTSCQKTISDIFFEYIYIRRNIILFRSYFYVSMFHFNLILDFKILLQSQDYSTVLTNNEKESEEKHEKVHQDEKVVMKFIYF